MNYSTYCDSAEIGCVVLEERLEKTNELLEIQVEIIQTHHQENLNLFFFALILLIFSFVIYQGIKFTYKFFK